MLEINIIIVITIIIYTVAETLYEPRSDCFFLKIFFLRYQPILQRLRSDGLYVSVQYIIIIITRIYI